MNIEFEATFPDVSIPDIQARLMRSGAKKTKPRTFYRRVVFNLPNTKPTDHIWGRVRDEGNKVTMSIKEWNGDGGIESQKELEVEVNDFDTAVHIMTKIGCVEKSYQESYREEWQLDDVHVTIDEWPWLEPFVEVEGGSEKEVQEISEKLNFDYSKAIFTNASTLYMKKYKISQRRIDHETPRITFDENPFAK